jgi:DNA-binding response OmpR family regulator
MLALIINSDQRLSHRIRAFLEQKGHTVDLATSAPSCLDISKTKPYEVIAIGLAPTGTSGITLCRALRKVSTQNARILLFGHYNSVDTKLDGFAAGADDCLASPFAMAELEARLVSLTRRHHHID